VRLSSHADRETKENGLKLIFVGDVVGKSGRRAVSALLPGLRKKYGVDVVIANAENSAGGFGVTRKSLDELTGAGVDFFTTGNHVWDKKEGVRLLDELDNIVRPGNYPGDSPGGGIRMASVNGTGIGIVNLQGRVFMPPLDCPFQWIQARLENLKKHAAVIVVDMHAEATSEKIAMGWFLDGRVSLVVGTHTHVPTRDDRILPLGTGYVTDVGMTGSYDGIIGVKKDAVITRFLNQRPTRFEVAGTDLRCDYIVAEIDDSTGKTRSIEHLQSRMEG
jgi:metallophosphoesterase (TIGR00282 family)